MYDCFLTYDLKHFPKPPNSPVRLLVFANDENFKLTEVIDNFKSKEEVKAFIDKMKNQHWRILWINELEPKKRKR